MSEKKICFIQFRRPSHDPVLYKVQDTPCRIGRAEENDICIPDPSISSLHAILIQNADGQWILEDQWSTNGIYNDGQRIQQIQINEPCHLVMGRVKIDLSLNSSDFSDEHEIVLSADKKVPSMGKEKDESSFSQPFYKDMEDDEAILPAATISRKVGSGKRGIICPHCWYRFSIEEFLFIARHQSLIGDPVLGEDAQQRFLPSRFSIEGNAIDAMGMSCPDMACPRCHLRIPQAASEMPPLFLSIVGATASGKSYFLTSMTWELRNTLAKNFAISFTDTDAVNNQIVNEFEETIFLNSDTDRLVALRKTELQGELYNQVLLDNMLINLPKPFMFTITPAEHHPRYAEIREKTSRTLVLYDNAGEHYEPGMDSVDNPTTQHLLHCDTIFFLFDPTKDVRFRKLLKDKKDPQLALHSRVQRQEIILTEMINRIKKYSGMRAGKKSDMTLMIIVSKCDIWKDLLEIELPENPWNWDFENNTSAVDVGIIKKVSFALRVLLEQICPELVSTAESFAGEVIYLPNSALGKSPELDPETGMIGVYPGDIKPFWGAVPMLYFFYQRGLIPGIVPADNMSKKIQKVDYQLSHDVYFVRLPGKDTPIQVPITYGGFILQYPGTDICFKLPKVK
ncbi:MAG: FHA domain-containing protein [Lentisphaeria bacterium]